MAQQSKEKIIEKAILILSRNPQYSMEQLADKLDISRATLYRYFKNRQALLKELILSSYETFCSVMEPVIKSSFPPEEKLRLFVKNFVPTGARFYFLIFNDMFFEDIEIGSLYKAQNASLEKLGLELKEAGVIDAEVPAEWFAMALEFLIYGAWEKIYQGDLAVNKAPDLVLKTILNGLSKK